MYTIIILGYGIYQTKAGVTKYAISFQTDFKDMWSHCVEGMEANTCDVDQITFNRIAGHKIGDKVKGVIARQNFKLQIIAVPTKEDLV